MKKKSVMEVGKHAVVSQKKRCDYFSFGNPRCFQGGGGISTWTVMDEYNFSWHNERRGFPREMHQQRCKTTKGQNNAKQQQACWYCQCGSSFQRSVSRPLCSSLMLAAAALAGLIKLTWIPSHIECYPGPPLILFESPEIYPRTHVSSVDSQQSTQAFQWEKDSLQQMVLEQLGKRTESKEPHPPPHTIHRN